VGIPLDIAVSPVGLFFSLSFSGRKYGELFPAMGARRKVWAKFLGKSKIGASMKAQGHVFRAGLWAGATGSGGVGRRV